MSGRIIFTLVLVAMVASCARVSESRLNPLNWFGRSQSAQVVTADPNADPRRLVDQVLSLRVEQVPGGAIIRAVGLPNRQGYYDAALLPVGREAAQNGVLNYELRASTPIDRTRVGTQQSRELVVGRFVSTQTLDGVSQIRVSGAGNALIVRR